MAMGSLAGKRGLVIGVANEKSIATGCALSFRRAGADLALTYLNEKAFAHVKPVADAVAARLLLPCDLREPGQLDAVFQEIEAVWGGLDFVLHSVAFAPREDLHASVVDCSAEGFALAMDVSCHSFLRVARLARPLMRNGGALMTVSFYGASKVVRNYNLMGPVKAALEACVRAAAVDLSPRNIRVFTLSAGAVATRAASGIDRFDELLDAAREQTPNRQLVSIGQIGDVAAFLAGEAAAPLTGSVIHADHGFNIVS
jgi:enoyl-[acyl-carrier protein] reductase I